MLHSLQDMDHVPRLYNVFEDRNNYYIVQVDLARQSKG